MRVLVLHNRYQVAGGEDTAVRQEVSMLRQAGLAVDLLEVTNEHIQGPLQRAATALNLVYSVRSRDLVTARIAALRPDLVHVHNFFPVLTPSIYDADSRIPFVQTLHNYRLLCANALLFRENKPCEDCVGKRIPWPAVQHACYRGSRAGSAAVALMLSVHRFRNTWSARVSRFIALTEFARTLFVNNLGIDAERIVVKPNAAPDPGVGDGAGGYALYVGRLSPEKGMLTLIAAAEHGFGIPLKVAGTGPLSALVERAAANGGLEYLGSQTPAQIPPHAGRPRAAPPFPLVRGAANGNTGSLRHRASHCRQRYRSLAFPGHTWPQRTARASRKLRGAGTGRANVRTHAGP